MKKGLVISPRLVGKEYFCLTLKVSKSELDKHLQEGNIVCHKVGRNTLTDIEHFYLDA